MIVKKKKAIYLKSENKSLKNLKEEKKYEQEKS